MRVKLLALGLAALLATPALVAADGHGKAMEKAVKARQANYQLYGFNFGGLVAMAKGEAEYNAEQAQIFANNLATLSTMNNGAMWPAGSDNEGAMKGKTRAKANIWSTYPAILEKGKAFGEAAAAMKAAAGTLDGVRANVGKVGATCKGCHDEYRAKDF